LELLLLLRCSLLHAEQKQHSLSFRWNSIRHFSSSSFSARLAAGNKSKRSHNALFSSARRFLLFLLLYTHSLNVTWLVRHRQAQPKRRLGK
jgi:hypothetical protein